MLVFLLLLTTQNDFRLKITTVILSFLLFYYYLNFKTQSKKKWCTISVVRAFNSNWVCINLSNFKNELKNVCACVRVLNYFLPFFLSNNISRFNHCRWMWCENEILCRLWGKFWKIFMHYIRINPKILNEGMNTEDGRFEIACVCVCLLISFSLFFCSSSFTHVHTVFPLSIFNDKEICAWSVSSSSSSISNWVFDARGRGGLGKNQTCNTPHTVSVQIKALNWNVYSIKWRPTG